MELPCAHGSSITTFAWLGGRACIWARGRRLGFWERREGDSSETHGGQGLSHGGAAVHTSRVGADRKHVAGRARAPPQREGQGAAHQALSPQLPHGAKCCGHMTRGPSTHCPPPMSTKQLLGASRAEEGPTKAAAPPRSWTAGLQAPPCLRACLRVAAPASWAFHSGVPLGVGPGFCTQDAGAERPWARFPSASAGGRAPNRPGP